MRSFRSRLVLAAAAGLACAAPALAAASEAAPRVSVSGELQAAAAVQGIELRSGSVLLHGSASNTSQPASVDYKRAMQATPEYKTIKSDGVRKGSARYQLLTAKMHKRIKAACAAVAKASGYDCVVKEKDVKNDNGLTVTDVTDDVIAELESGDDGS